MTPWRESETLGEVIERNMTDHANKVALIYRGRSHTYAEYGTRARRLANALYDRGVRRQHRVAILAQNSNAHLEAYAACELTGYIAAAVNYRLAGPEIHYVLKDSDVLVMLGAREDLEKFREVA